jgi:octaprenyl-diphosphate synthase
MQAWPSKLGYLFDYTSDNIGKPTGNDIKEKKLTLPLIYTLNNIDHKTRRKIIFIIKNENKDKEKVKYVIEKVIECGGITYTMKKMNEFKQRSIDVITSISRQSLPQRA